MKRRNFIKNCFGTGTVLLTGLAPNVHLSGSESDLPEPEWNRLPRWRGFNLTEKIFGDAPFQESDFRNIHDLGFDFVRIGGRPWYWTDRSDHRKFNEKTLKDIDQALEFGRKYKIHVNLCFSYPPGHPAPPARENKDREIWTNLERRDLWAFHWGMFAKRYRGIPNSRLSFDLLNEPDPAPDLLNQYFETIKTLTEAIRAESPDRLIICDGIDWGKKPCAALAKLKVAQSTRGYVPHTVSHYKMPWVSGADTWPVPHWPDTNLNGRIHRADRKDIPEDARQSMRLNCDFSQPVQIRVRVGFVGTGAILAIVADGKELYRHEFTPGKGPEEWTRCEKVPNTSRSIAWYQFDAKVTLPAGTQKVEIQNATRTGDHLLLTEIGLKTEGGKERLLQCFPGWEDPSSRVSCRMEGNDVMAKNENIRDRNWLQKNCYDPWLDFQKTTGSGVMVGEFGCGIETPHQVMLAWLEDLLKCWREAGWGWAMWNFRGGMGVANTGRKDIVPDQWHGLKLDRKLVKLLQKY